MTNKASTAGTRTLRVLAALKGHTITGVSNVELANQLGESAPNITRALHTLIEEGFVTQLDNGRFAHSIKVLQIAQAHFDHVERIQNRIHDINQRIVAGA